MACAPRAGRRVVTEAASTTARPSSSTFDIAQATTPEALLYPTCPASALAGTGTNSGDTGQVFNDLAPYALSDPPCSQQNSWSRHSHPKFEDFKPIDTKNLGPCAK